MSDSMQLLQHLSQFFRRQHHLLGSAIEFRLTVCRYDLSPFFLLKTGKGG